MIVYLYYIYFVNGNVTTRSVTDVKTKLMITKILVIVFLNIYLSKFNHCLL